MCCESVTADGCNDAVLELPGNDFFGLIPAVLYFGLTCHVTAVENARRIEQQRCVSEVKIAPAACSERKVFPTTVAMAPAKRKSTDGPGSAQKPKIQKALQQSGGKVASVPLDGLVGQVTAWFLGAANCCPLSPSEVGREGDSFGRG